MRCRQSASGADAQDAVRELLGVPAHYGVLGMLALGVPAKPAAPHDLPDAHGPEVHRGRF